MVRSDEPVAVVAQRRRMFGYKDETAAVIDALTRAEWCGALIVGSAGSGKTTVINEALARIAPSSTVLKLRGSTNSATRNLGIFEVLLSQAGYPADLAPGIALSVLARIIRDLEKESPPIVIVDNADRVDEHSISVLAQLTDAEKIKLCVGTETTQKPVDLIAELWLSGRIRRVDLAGIDESAVASMVKTVGTADSEPRSASELYSSSRGNPQLLESLLHGRHRLDRAAARLFTRIDQDDLGTIEVLALVRALPYECLLRLSAPNRVDALVELGVIGITSGREAVVTLRDAAVAESLRASARPSRSLELFKRLVAVLDESRLGPSAVFGFVSWSLSLGVRRAVEQVLTAVNWANSNGDYTSALRILQASGHSEPNLLLEKCRAQRSLGDLRAARATLDVLCTRALVEESESTEDYDRFLSRLASMDIRLTDPLHPENLRAGWVRDRLKDPRALGRLDVTRARYEIKSGRLEAGLELASKVYRDHAVSTRHRLRACALLGVSEVMGGRIQRGLKYIEQARLMFELPGMTTFEYEDATPQFFIAYYVAGKWDLAKSALSSLSSNRRLEELTGALVDVRTGHIDRALGIMESLRLDFRASDLVDVTFIARSAMGYSARVLGKPCEAKVATSELPIDESVFSWWAVFEARLLEFQELGLFEPELASRKLFDLGASAQRIGANALATLAFIEAALLADRRAISCLTQVASLLDGDFGALARIVASGLSSGEASSLLESAREAFCFGSVVLCSALAKLARDRAIATGESAAVKEARRLMHTAQRTIAFSVDSVPLETVLSGLENALVGGIVKGRSNVDLGRELHLSVRTVEWHLSRIYRRLHVSTRTELRKVASEWSRK